MTYIEFRNKYNGKQVKHVGGSALKGSCWDLVAFYFEQVLGLTTWYLNELMFNLNTQGKFDEVKSTEMRPGDVCIWHNDHVCIFNSWDGKQNHYLSQDLNGRLTGIYTNVTTSKKPMRVFRLKGWNKEQPKPVEPPKEETKPETIKIGDTVTVNGYGTSDSYGGGAKTITYTNKLAKVVKIVSDRARPYALNLNNNMNGVTGWFRKEDIK